MLQARAWIPKRSSVTAHGLLVAGGAAGIAAAFNPSLPGVMFGIEELVRKPEQRSSGLIIAAIVLAGVIAVSVHGNGTAFGMIHTMHIGMGLLLPGLGLAIVCGLAGGVFSRLLLASLDGRDPMSRLRAARPVVFALVCGLAVALIGVVSGGATFGSGYASTRHMVDGSIAMPAGYALLKLPRHG